MSKDLSKFFQKIRDDFDLVAKLRATYNAGSRIAPSKTSKNDASYQLRLDAGELIGDRYLNVALQVNSQARGSALKDWARKNGTHATLATAQFDTKADDPGQEAERVMAELEDEAKNSI